jgi:translin
MRTGKLENIINTIDTDISSLDADREWALQTSREIIRKSGALIMSCHRGQPKDELLEGWKELHTAVLGMRERLQDSGHLYHKGYIEAAQAEATEAGIVVQILLHEGSDSPSWDFFPIPSDLGVRSSSYLKGLGDVIGELRRFTLERLRTENIESAEWFYGLMEEIYSLLTTLGYSHVSSELRKKLDTGRVLLERTLGELVNVKHMSSLERSLASRGGHDPAT